MLAMLEYLVIIGGSLAIFFFTRATNMGVRQFTLYLCLLVVWSIMMFVALRIIHKLKSQRKSSA